MSLTDILNAYFQLIALSVLSNILCGYIRASVPKFSPKWFLWVHASIPFLIYFRITNDITPWFIPTVIAMAVFGQMIGATWRSSTMTENDQEKLAQIPDLNLPKTYSVNPSEVMIPLLNMGGPRKIKDVKAFQKRLFKDPLLIRLPLSFLMQNIFANILIFFRLNAVKQLYREIGGGSPIYRSTTRQAAALRKELQKRGISSMVTFSFNYSPPLPSQTIAKAKRYNQRYILPLSLYPHYSKATTGSNIHYLKKAAETHYPELQFLESPVYYLHDGYIQAFVDRIHEAVADGDLNDYYLVFTAHGLPLYFLTEGDLYPYQINQTVSKVLAKLQRDSRWVLCFQSEVGPLQWLKPSTEDTLEALSKRGVRKLLMIPIAFVGDHIETLHEIDIEYRKEAEEHGIDDFRMSKAIETHPGFIAALADSVERVIKQETKQDNNNTQHQELQNV